MKAKQYAAALVATTTPEAYEEQLFAFLDELTKSTIAQVKQRQNAASSMSCVRETFTKWKSIVANVKASMPDAVIDDAVFVKYFSYVAPALFAMAVESKVFLGYSLDLEDRVTVSNGRAELENMALKARLAELQREARLLGIPEALLVAHARRHGEL